MATAFLGKVLAPNHKPHHLLPEPRKLGYELRAATKYSEPALRTNGAKQILLNYALAHWR